MDSREAIECAWRELRRRRWRAFTTVFGYGLSVCVLVVLVSALGFSRRETDAILESTGTHFVAYSPVGGPECAECRTAQAPADEEGFIVYGRPTRLIPFRVVERAQAISGVKKAAPYLLYRFKDPTSPSTLSVGGFDPDDQSAVGTTCCAPSDIIAGRFLTAADKGSAMLEEAYALSRGLEPGRTIEIAGAELTVVGVVNPGVRPGKADVYVHFSDAEKLINGRLGLTRISREANLILVEVKSSLLQDSVMRSVRGLLPGLVISSYACYRPAAKVVGMNETAVWVLTAVVGLFAVLLAAKSQLASVMERRRELAILRAIGWTRRSVSRQILLESTLQALAGGVLGCLAGGGALLAAPARLLTGTESAQGVGVGISPSLFGAGILLVLLGGLIAGAVPALLAAREVPAEALRRA